MKENIIKGEFEIPAWVSSSLRNLLRGMLAMDPKDRISVQGALASPWIQKYAPQPFSELS